MVRKKKSREAIAFLFFIHFCMDNCVVSTTLGKYTIFAQILNLEIGIFIIKYKIHSYVVVIISNPFYHVYT